MPVQYESFGLFDQFMPDLLITSATSLPLVEMSEKYLWRQAKQRGIPSLAFLDQWQNYAIRFSGTQKHERLAYLPDWINCLNAIGRSEMIREGFDSGRLLEFGHPYLASLKQDLTTLDVGAIRDALHISAQSKVALFASEPIREYCGESRGYDQHEILEYFLARLSAATNPPFILVKLHPKDDRASYQTLAAKYKALRLTIVSNELSPLECLAASDFVFGMTSIMLIEAYVLGKYVVSLQPGLCVEDPMVLSRHHLIPVVLDKTSHNLLELDYPPRGLFHTEFAAKDFLDFVKQALH